MKASEILENLEVVQLLALPDSILGLTIDYSTLSLPFDSTLYPARIISSLFDGEQNSKIGPTRILRYYYIFIKHAETGARIKPLTEVVDDISTQIINEKLNSYKNQILCKLKSKYKLYNNLNVESFLRTQ
jgi:hypothetical protein